MEVIEEVVVSCWQGGDDSAVFVPIQDSITQEFYISSSALKSSENKLLFFTITIRVNKFDGITKKI